MVSSDYKTGVILLVTCLVCSPFFGWVGGACFPVGGSASLRPVLRIQEREQLVR